MKNDGISHVNSHELAHMLLCSFRYSLGRMTYITSTCAGWLAMYWDIIPHNWKCQIHDDINKAISQGHAGHECDVESWKKILALPLTESKDVGSL